MFITVTKMMRFLHIFFFFFLSVLVIFYIRMKSSMDFVLVRDVFVLSGIDLSCYVVGENNLYRVSRE